MAPTTTTTRYAASGLRRRRHVRVGSHPPRRAGLEGHLLEPSNAELADKLVAPRAGSSYQPWSPRQTQQGWVVDTGRVLQRGEGPVNVRFGGQAFDPGAARHEVGHRAMAAIT